MARKTTYEELEQRVKELETESTRRKEAEQKLGSIFHKSLDALMIIDGRSGLILSVNETTRQILGYEEDELKDKHLSSLFPRSDELLKKDLVDEFQVFGSVFTQDFVRSDGSVCLLDLTATLVPWGKGEAILATFRDSTERRQAEEGLRGSEERLRTITDTAKDAVIMLNDEGKILYWNPAAQEIFGYSSQEALGGDLHMFLAPERYHDAYFEGFIEFKRTGRGGAVGKTIELAAIRKDGTEFPIELSLSAIHTKDKWHAVGIVRDITDRKQMEEERERLIRELKDALAKVKTLSGLLPICAACKKIRDDKGYWNQIESYIRDRSEADFSHGICPECAKRLYPELYPDT